MKRLPLLLIPALLACDSGASQTTSTASVAVTVPTSALAVPPTTATTIDAGLPVLADPPIVEFGQLDIVDGNVRGEGSRIIRLVIRPESRQWMILASTIADPIGTLELMPGGEPGVTLLKVDLDEGAAWLHAIAQDAQRGNMHDPAASIHRVMWESRVSLLTDLSEQPRIDLRLRGIFHEFRAAAALETPAMAPVTEITIPEFTVTPATSDGT